MAVTSAAVRFSASDLERVQAQLSEHGLEAWLLFDFHGLNHIACGMLGLPPLTRRWFCLIPREGTPVAVTHVIEQQPWREWIGENRPYSGWRELERTLEEVLQGFGSVAMEYSAGDAVPYIDRVPAGVIELVRQAGVEISTSAPIVSALYARWSIEGERSHRRAARILQATAHDAFARVGERIREVGSVNEWEIKEWVRDRLRREGLMVGEDCIVAGGENAANPHYAPSAEDSRLIGRGDVVLIDLWGKESEEAVYADQTWMAYIGEEVPARIQHIWLAVRDARDAAVELAHSRWVTGSAVTGADLDDAARDLITARGFGEAFVHRTGHSIDRELHGSGPNLDNLETRDARRLIQGVGFSVEPGVYLAGDVGFRSEINVFIAERGPEVTTPDPQSELILIRA